MSSNSQAQLLARTGLLTTGLLNNLDKVALRGIDDHFVHEMKALHDQVMGLESEQEALKSRLKEKTAEVLQVLTELKNRVSVARKIIKIQVPQAGWKEFGITDVK
jgi:hypothetical protein